MDSTYVMSVFWLFVLCRVGPVWSSSYEDAERLLDYLLGSRPYRTDIRPSFNQSEPLRVSVTHMLRSIIELNLEESYIRTSSELHVTWRDFTLAWNISDFNGIGRVHLPDNKFWSPAVIVVDAIESTHHGLVDTSYSPTWVTSDGAVSTFIAASFTSRCDIDSRTFPLDKHMCYIVVMSVKHTEQDITLVADQNVDIMVNYDAHPLWDIKNTTIHTTSISKGSDSFLMLIYSVTVERKIMLFSTLQSWIPLIGMFVLNTISVFVPVDSGERLSFSVTVYLAIVIASDSLMLKLPEASERVSISVITLLLYSLINALTVAWTVLIMCVSRFTGDVPRWLCRLIKLEQKELDHDQDELTTTEEGDLDQGSQSKVETKMSYSIDASTSVTWIDVSRKLDKIFLYTCIAIYIVLCIAGTAATLIIINTPE